MRRLDTIRYILNESDNQFVGTRKPHGRVTVEKNWQLKTTGTTYGRLKNGPYRYFTSSAQDLANPLVETEVPNIDSITINRSLDQESATCTIIMSNTQMLDNDETPPGLLGALGIVQQLGLPGYFGHDYGGGDNAFWWGQVENTWKNVLVPNAMLRTYQGYGGYTESDGVLIPDPIITAVNNGNLALTGIWLIDNVSMGTDGKLRLQCRDMAKLLIEQMLYPPLVPERHYPPEYYRFEYENVPATPSEEGTPGSEPGALPLRYEDSSVERWWGANSWLGERAPKAFNSDEYTGLSAGSGWKYWNNDYAKDWWQASCSGEVNEIYISMGGEPIGGSYFGYISIMEDGEWVKGWRDWGDTEGVIPYDGDDPGSAIQTYHPEKPSLDTGINFVRAVAVAPIEQATFKEGVQGGEWFKLPRTYNAEKIRVTMGSTWDSPWGPNTYRSSMAQIKARLVSEDPVSEESAVTTEDETIEKDGNIRDWLDPVREILMWAGFLNYTGGRSSDNVGANGENEANEQPSDPNVVEEILEQAFGPKAFAVLEPSGTYPLNMLHADMFDKKPAIEPIISIKEVLGYVFFVDENGRVHFHSPNWWASGNMLEGEKENYIHEVRDDVQLTDFTSTFTGNSTRSEIIIGSDLSDEDENASTQYVTFDPLAVQPDDAPDLLRGMVRPAIWINEVWTNEDEQKLMAALIALHSWFNSRQGNVTIVANPEIQIDDQIRVYERSTSESWIHYVRSVNSTMNLQTGEYTMTLGTNWLGELDNWAFNRDNLLKLSSKSESAASEAGVNGGRNGDYDNGSDSWRNEKDPNAIQGQDLERPSPTEPSQTHGVGGTWKVAVVGPPGDPNAVPPIDQMNANTVQFFASVAEYAKVQIDYVSDGGSPPSGYDVIVIPREASAANSWGSLSLSTTPIIHNHPNYWDNNEFSSEATANSVDSTTIDAQTNAAFEIAGAPGTVTFGDGGTVTTLGEASGNLPTGIISVGESAGGDIVIGAIPAGSTFDDANVSVVKHVVFGSDLRDIDAQDAVVWEAMGDAILWTRS